MWWHHSPDNDVPSLHYKSNDYPIDRTTDQHSQRRFKDRHEVCNFHTSKWQQGWQNILNMFPYIYIYSTGIKTVAWKYTYFDTIPEYLSSAWSSFVSPVLSLRTTSPSWFVFPPFVSVYGALVFPLFLAAVIVMVWLVRLLLPVPPVYHCHITQCILVGQFQFSVSVLSCVALLCLPGFAPSQFLRLKVLLVVFLIFWTNFN